MPIQQLIQAPPPDLHGIVRQAIPVPYFGNDLYSPTFATVGINPSQNEFPDHLPNRPADVGDDAPLNDEQTEEARASLRNYFEHEPYWSFFYALEDVLRRLDASFTKNAIHLDLIPWATHPAWSSLNGPARDAILAHDPNQFQDTLNELLSLKCLLANGNMVTRQLWHKGNNPGNVQWMPIVPPYGLWTLARWNWNLNEKRTIRVVGWNCFLPRQHMPDAVKVRIVELVEG